MVTMRTLVLLVFLSLTPAWAISYTVQLFASSDQSRASQLQEQLAGQGYPAYLLSVPTAQGQVYRIRVGAFANRAAAALFAEVLPSVEGSTPSPALAEGGVLPGFIPLQPALLGQYDVETTLVQIFPWPVVESGVPETPQESSQDAVTENVGTENVGTENVGTENVGTGNPVETTEDSSTEETSTTTVQTTSSTDESQPSDEASSDLSTEAGNTGDDSVDSSSGETTSSEQNSLEDAEETTGTNEVAQGNSPDETTNAGTENGAEPAVVVRVQPKDASEQAHYRIGDLEFDAWRAAPLDDGWILRVRSFSVWPEDWQTASEVERAQYRETVLANLSGDLDLTPQQLEPFVFEQEDKAPFVVLVERFNPETEQVERLRSVGQPRPNQDNLGLTLYGPSTFLGETVEIALPEENTIFEPNERTPVADDLLGNGWQAGSDDGFVTLSVGDKTWRAAVGQPLWASGNLLISFYEGQILVYHIQQP
jgi:hypothetical protein